MHAGGVLDPGVISNITAKAVRTEFSGKVSGATALIHAAGLASPLRVANLFSSLAAFSGSGGQGGYAAANGALDALAQDMQASVHSLLRTCACLHGCKPPQCSKQAHCCMLPHSSISTSTRGHLQKHHRRDHQRTVAGYA